jgi:hypothetical protein
MGRKENLQFSVDLARIVTPHFFNNNFNNILPSTSLITNYVFPTGFETENLCPFAFLLNALPITIFLVSRKIVSFSFTRAMDFKNVVQ